MADPKSAYRLERAQHCFNMLVLKEGRPKDVPGDMPGDKPKSTAKSVRDACAQSAFDYADAFIEACVKQGHKPWEEA